MKGLVPALPALRQGGAVRGPVAGGARLGALALALLAPSGCAADLGLGGGAEAAKGHAVGLGRFAASTRVGSPLNDHGLLLGASVENRIEHAEGSRFTGGIMVGGGFGPGAIGGSPIGFEGYGEAGTPLRSTLFRDGSFYAGGGLNVPIRLDETRHISELNDSTWVLMRRFELVPTLRARLHVDHPGAESAYLRYDVGALLSLRMRVFNDFF